MGQDTDQIRDEIEATRSRMGDTVEAIGYKADVPSRVRDSVNERISSVKGSIGDAVGNTKDAVFGKVSDMSNSASDAIADARSGSADASASTRRTVSMAMENPLGLAIGALALGILGGLLIPVTDIERERLGPVRDELAGRAQTMVTDAVDAGKSVFNDTIAAATDSAQKHGKEIVENAVSGTPLEGTAAKAGS